MIFYTVNNLLILFWAALLCWRKPSPSKNLFFVFITFTQFFLIMVCRFGIGYDYNMYANGFINMNEDGFSVLNYKDWELGFVILTKLLGQLLPNYVWYMGFFTLIALIPAAIFIYANSEIPWVSTILYVNLFLFFMAMNFTRQMIALSLLMLAWHFMKRNKFIPYLIIIIIASFFHQTVLFMIPVYLIVKLKPGIKELLIYGYLLLWFFMCSNNFIDLITAFYHEEYAGSIFIIEGVSFVYAILPMFVTIVAFILVKTETLNITVQNKYLINLTLIGTIMMVTMSRHSIIERLSYYFLIFMIVLVPTIYRSLRIKGIRIPKKDGEAIELTSESQKKKLAVLFMVIVLVLSYAHFYYGLNDNAHGAATYQTWLNYPWVDILSH